jgi:putative FmdB family regulatory protein
MPIYEYRCEKGHTFEVRQSFSDDPVETCEKCERPVRKVMHPVAVHFKGKGFYNTDYGTRKRSREAKEGGEGGKSLDGSSAPSSGDSGSSGDSKGGSSESKSSSSEGNSNSGESVSKATKTESGSSKSKTKTD